MRLVHEALHVRSVERPLGVQVEPRRDALPCGVQQSGAGVQRGGHRDRGRLHAYGGGEVDGARVERVVRFRRADNVNRVLQVALVGQLCQGV